MTPQPFAAPPRLATSPHCVHRRVTAALLAATTFAATVIAANTLTARYGLIPVGLGQTPSAGTAGLTLLSRDWDHRAAGRTAVLACIGTGAAARLGRHRRIVSGRLSWLLQPPTRTPLRPQCRTLPDLRRSHLRLLAYRRLVKATE